MNYCTVRIFLTVKSSALPVSWECPRRDAASGEQQQNVNCSLSGEQLPLSSVLLTEERGCRDKSPP